MPPKKAKKISLNEFLGAGESGSWADEMDNLPNAPAIRTDEERANDRYGRRDDFLSTRPDRGSATQRDDLPLPTQPPYTAFIGNLAFDLTESELDEFFGSPKTKSIKIIKDREDKPKGFGYIEFLELDGLKDALAKSGSNLSGRSVRVSVAEPPKDRPGFGGGFDDEAKFDSPWRRDGPPPAAAISREPSRRRFDGGGDRALSSLSEGPTDWRASSRPPARTEPDAPSFRRKPSGFGGSEGQPSAADTEESWKMGSKFKPAPTVDDTGSKFGRPRGDMGPPREPVSTIPDEVDWRAAARTRPAAKDNTSPTGSTPPTPQLSRRKLELLPRSGSGSVSPSPLSSPKLAHSPAIPVPVTRSSPFGAARPVDVTSKEKEVMERIEKERSMPMSRTSSLRGSERPPVTRAKSPPPSAPATRSISSAPTVRPTLSFANAAKKDATVETKTQDAPVANSEETSVADVAEKLAQTDI